MMGEVEVFLSRSFTNYYSDFFEVLCKRDSHKLLEISNCFNLRKLWNGVHVAFSVFFSHLLHLLLQEVNFSNN